MVGRVLQQAGRLEDALPVLQQVASEGRGTAQIEALAALSNVLRDLGRAKEAKETGERALALSKARAYPRGEARALLALGNFYFVTGDPQNAQTSYERSLTIAGRLGDREIEATARGNLGQLLLELGEHTRATQELATSLALSRSIGYRPQELRTRNGLARLARDLGDPRTALGHLKEAERLAAAMGNRQAQATIATNLGYLLIEMEDLQAALSTETGALLLHRELGFLPGQAAATLALGNIAYFLSDFTRARALYERAIDIYQRIGDRAGEATPWMNLGATDQARGDVQAALTRFDRAARLYEAIGDRAGAANALGNIASLHQQQGNAALASKGAESALNVHRTLGLRVHEAFDLIKLGAILTDLKDLVRAEQSYREALSLALAAEVPSIIWDARFGLGRVAERKGRLDEAFQFYRQAIAGVEEARERLTVEASRAGFLEDKIELYEAMVSLLVETGRTREAFEYAERARARAFLDLLGAGRVQVRPGDAAIVERVRDLKVRLAALEERRRQELGRGQRNQALLRSIGQDIESTRRAFALAREQLQSQGPEVASLVSVRPVDLGQVQGLLGDRAALVAYFLTKNRLLVWIVRRSSLKTVTIEVRREALTQKVREAREALANPDLAADLILADLYRYLMAPVTPYLRDGERVIVVPHDALFFLPFQALLRDGRPVLQNYVMSYTPSASVLAYATRKATGRKSWLLAIGDPRYPDPSTPRLPGARAEAREIARLYPGATLLTDAAAGEAGVRQMASRYDLVHFATHAFADEERPMRSRLLFAQDRGTDGVLETYEVFSMNLRASLVTLSACETALGRLTRGDGIVGLSRAFIYAGTPAVLASLWPVADEPTRMLMVAFYRNLKTMPTDQALRAAQATLRRQYPHPAYWAPFILIGDAR